MLMLLENILREPRTGQSLEVKNLQEVFPPLSSVSLGIGEPWTQLSVLLLDSKNLEKGLA
jgi:hypothetical protein